jgi:hypothetical protein
MDEDVLTIATKTQGPPGVRVAEVDALMKYTRFHIETLADSTVCSACGIRAVLHK